MVDDISGSEGCAFFGLEAIALHVEAVCALEPIIGLLGIEMGLGITVQVG